MIDLYNIPEDFDWRTAYFNLNDKYHASLLREIDLKKTASTLYDALKRWTDLAADKAPDSLMLEMANVNVSTQQ